MCLWLADEVRTAAENDAAWAPLASTLVGFAAMYCVYTSSGQQLTEIEAQKLSDARSAGMEGYNWLSRDASRRSVFGYVMKPKFHKLDKAVRKAVATRRNPAWFWTFSDESWIGSLGKLSGSMHKKTVHRRVCQRWLAMSFVELRRVNDSVGTGW